MINNRTEEGIFEFYFFDYDLLSRGYLLCEMNTRMRMGGEYCDIDLKSTGIKHVLDGLVTRK